MSLQRYWKELERGHRPDCGCAYCTETILTKADEQGDYRRERLRSKVREQINEILAANPDTDDWHGGEELPGLPNDDTYRSSFGRASKDCPHKNSISISLSRRERQCTDCGRYFTGDRW